MIDKWSAVSGNGGRFRFAPRFLATFATILCDLCDITKYFFYSIVILFSFFLMMPNKSKSRSKSSSAEAKEGCKDAEFASGSIRELQQLQLRGIHCGKSN